MSDQPINPWSYKPWWCQPWSIVLTGIALIGGSWIGLHLWWITLIVSIPVLVWMIFFVVFWPKLVMESGILAQGGDHNLSQSDPSQVDPTQNPTQE